MLLRLRKPKVPRLSEEILCDILAEVDVKKRDAEGERKLKERHLQSLRSKARQSASDKDKLSMLARECAYTESLIQFSDSAIEAALNSWYIVERTRILLRTRRIAGDFAKFMESARLGDSKLAESFEKMTDTIDTLNARAMVELESLHTVKQTEPAVEDRVKDWELQLLKEASANNTKLKEESLEEDRLEADSIGEDVSEVDTTKDDSLGDETRDPILESDS